ncbi:helix-turn-helix domain-containing protein [Halovulum dunhuangense]|uniref:Helix-turn-helix domain-containing protein n=1 Tax=Halovulum dunhuangense TaxID=1505036 RepID=A0A849L796_9RHOB|nr:helix-turn-helix domain-containing protein [Halovulum dunhuangense]NNU82014.1 helix-turn-helix domain-containing protein [Halovulum dunhuangense]
MADSSYQDLRQLHLFEAMADDHFAALMRCAFVQTFPPQVELITEGDPSDFLHIVLSGAVDLFSIWNGRETSMATVRPISTFILAATIRDAPYLMSARTLEKSRIALIPSEEVRTVFGVDDGFARAIVSELAQCYRSVIKAQKDLKLRSSTERLANYLLRAQLRTGGQAEFHLGMEKRRLASVLGVTPEHLSRAFRGLQSHGVLAEGARIRIEDRSKLERYARPNPLIDDAAS